ncbi:hypothetical protein Y032_0074g829 [Ancylostoma ceylanicum]|uniref:Uncharacterized protein n=1 Tax=Ancylostoma ceylanicum TaxID=53326 RepID=A0A016TV55_9BILA|nr:hypothetical protein Y032_0074g829 [Ancylostoma ceylanicum]
MDGVYLVPLSQALATFFILSNVGSESLIIPVHRKSTPGVDGDGLSAASKERIATAPLTIESSQRWRILPHSLLSGEDLCLSGAVAPGTIRGGRKATAIDATVHISMEIFGHFSTSLQSKYCTIFL